ncbi:hypothetical protein [Myxococcus virescens]|uniref:Lipoprotein n=2 Tax=Myxococcus virescens TaxID=83456 RepID=A0ABY0MJF7_9BACT|nr:hypothetical protein [Myxococcus virescens]SDD65864.1 hypothetical protein SAMN04488504_102160 [Myxococcus virescens]
MHWMLLTMVVVMAGCASPKPSRFSDAQHRRAQASMDCFDAAEAQVAGGNYAGWSSGETTCLQRLVAADCASRAWAKDGDHQSSEAAARYQSRVLEDCGADLTERVRAAFEAGL